MSQHTPGPWIVQGPNNDIGCVQYGLLAATRYLGNAPEKEAEHYANARLMAAAPDMLAALQALLRTQSHEDYPWELVHAAIDKATKP